MAPATIRPHIGLDSYSYSDFCFHLHLHYSYKNNLVCHLESEKSKCSGYLSIDFQIDIQIGMPKHIRAYFCSIGSYVFLHIIEVLHCSRYVFVEIRSRLKTLACVKGSSGVLRTKKKIRICFL